MKAIQEVLSNPMAERIIKNLVPELKERNDYEAAYKMYPCSSCEEENIHGLTYKFHHEDTWHDVSHAQYCRQCMDLTLTTIVPKQIDSSRKQSLMKEYWFIPDDLKDAGFKNYKPTNQVTANALNICKKFVKNFLDNPDKRHNLLIMGNPGTGKSHLCVTIARTIREKGFTVGFLTTGQLLTIIKATYNKGAERTEEQILEDIRKFDLLILDDLGAETHNTGKEFSWTKTKLFDIINARIKRPTIYTSNLNDKALEKAVGERVFSRLYNNTEFLDVYTEDYRKSLRVNVKQTEMSFVPQTEKSPREGEVHF